MSDKALRAADRVEAAALNQIHKGYEDAVEAVLDRHKDTIRQIGVLEQDGHAARARRLYRASGLLEDLAQALSQAARQAGEEIRRMRSGVLEVMSDDDGG